MRAGLLLAAATITACATDASARVDTSDSESRVTRMSDEAIVATLSAINATEISAANMAVRQASRADVRALAEQIIRDHAAMQDSAAAAAHTDNHGAEQPLDAVAIRARGRSLLDTLATMSGAAFDLAYIDAQVNDHQMALQSIHVWQRFAMDSRLRALLRKARPVVQAHYDAALALLPSLIPGGESSLWKKHLGQPMEASGKPSTP